LSKTNTLLRDNYEKHASYLTNPDIHTNVINEVNKEFNDATKTSQATNVLRYEAEQFRVGDLWQAASPSRHKVLDLREKVFGTGGRRLPQGSHGAHGKFNRLQWTLDGQERLVDKFGRTESEADEEDHCLQGLESRTGRSAFSELSLIRTRTEDDEDGAKHGEFLDHSQEPVTPALDSPELSRTTTAQEVSSAAKVEEEEPDVVRNARMKPLWLLNIFTRWGGGWGAAPAAPEATSSDVVPVAATAGALAATAVSELASVAEATTAAVKSITNTTG